MYYIDAKKLVQLAIQHGCLTTHTQQDSQTGDEETGILIYREGSELPELWSDEYLVLELMIDSDGEAALIAALAEKGVPFERFEGSKADLALDSICAQFQEGGC